MPSAQPQPIARLAYGLHQAGIVDLAAQSGNADVEGVSALAEAATRLQDGAEGVTDEIWEAS